jgi:hypothetical protein
MARDDATLPCRMDRMRHCTRKRGMTTSTRATNLSKADADEKESAQAANSTVPSPLVGAGTLLH